MAHLLKSYDDILFATLLSCCFYGCHRSGELVWNNDKSQWDWRKVIKRASLSFFGNHVQYRLPYHKADPFYHETDVLFTQHDIADLYPFFKNMYPSVILSMAPTPPFSFEKTAAFQHDHGSTKSSLHYSTVILVVLLQEQAVQHTMQVLDSLNQ